MVTTNLNHNILKLTIEVDDPFQILKTTFFREFVSKLVEHDETWFATASQWAVSLRDAWEISPGEWRGFKFPSVKYIPPPKVVERIGYADRLGPPLKYFDHADAHLKKHKKEWGRWEKYSSDVADRLRTAEPHYPEFSYLKVKRAL